MFLDLKLGNICNLKCRICGSWSSSTFATEEVQQLDPSQKRYSFHYDMLRRGQWPRENAQFWQQIDHLVDQIRYIEFTGGEPFMIDQHFDLLQGIVDRGRAGQVEIHYNTNGTQWPQRGPDIWRHFRTVEVAFSIDDVGERFEYQRTNARWPDVNHNLHQFRDLRSQHPNIQLQCCSTVNVFNVMYLEELADWIDDQAFDFVYWNMLHEAQYLSVASMPNLAKQVAQQRLSQAVVSPQHQQEFARIQDFMILGTSLDGQQLREHIQLLDKRRGSSLLNTHPELARAIGLGG
jgi:MoaA/NifB/PqqE/SkfB family radical SAM enzyme